VRFMEFEDLCLLVFDVETARSRASVGIQVVDREDAFIH
jgi:hypothetical protein